MCACTSLLQISRHCKNLTSSITHTHTHTHKHTHTNNGWMVSVRQICLIPTACHCCLWYFQQRGSLKTAVDATCISSSRSVSSTSSWWSPVFRRQWRKVSSVRWSQITVTFCVLYRPQTRRWVQSDRESSVLQRAVETAPLLAWLSTTGRKPDSANISITSRILMLHNRTALTTRWRSVQLFASK